MSPDHVTIPHPPGHALQPDVMMQQHTTAAPGAPEFLEVGSDRRTIAVRRAGGDSPGLVWLGGFRSDMKGTKAEALARFAADEGRAFVRFDYSGHGESRGDFAARTIGRCPQGSGAGFIGLRPRPQAGRSASQ